MPTFDEFWAIWPKREAKKDARRAWDKLKPDQRIAALAALPAHVERWRREARVRNHIPHPATWLNGERWEDELGEIFPASTHSPQRRQTPAQALGLDPRWYESHVGMDRAGRALGIGPALRGETEYQYKARINQAIDERLRYGASTH